MADSVNKIFNIMKRTNKEMSGNGSTLVTLTIKSTNPLILTRDDRTEITEEFCVFSNGVNKKNFHVGDVITAFVFNDGQQYFIQQNNTIDESYYKPGDTLSISNYMVLNGFINSDSTYIALSLTLPKKLNYISSISVTAFRALAMGVDGFLNSNSSTYNFKSDTNYTVTASKITTNNITINIRKSSAFTNVTSSTPVVFSTSSIKLSFS